MLLDHFSQAKVNDRPLTDYLQGDAKVEDLETLRQVLDYIHMSQGLLKPYGPDYPIIEPHELLPSFDDNLFEYHYLPRFSMIALDRPLNYLAERFQFDLLSSENGASTKQQLREINKGLFKSRLPREFHHDFDNRLDDRDITELANYPEVLNFLFHMDRAHVIAKTSDGSFNCLGMFASLPSNLDKEIKKFGKQIGKFVDNDNSVYQVNRTMVYQFLMELYGFPISSERRTSAALFARTLARWKERYLIKVLGQSDRVITTLYYPNTKPHYPKIEKSALVPIASVPRDTIRELTQAGFMVDPDRRIVLLRTVYQQHRYNKNNIVEDRALSLEHQEIIHPRTGECYPFLNVLQAREDRLLRFNDIVRGEYSGNILYEKQEIIETTVDHESRLKFISAWFTKHQRRCVVASPVFIEKLQNILDSYLQNPDNSQITRRYEKLYNKIHDQMKYIVQAASINQLEQARTGRVKISRLEFIELLIRFLNENQADINNYSMLLLEKLLFLCRQITGDKYIIKRYVTEVPRTKYGRMMNKSYKRLNDLTNALQKKIKNIPAA